MTGKNNRFWTIAIILVLAAAGIVTWRRVSRREQAASVNQNVPASAPASQTASTPASTTPATDDENLAALYSLSDIVYRVTYHMELSYDDDDGNPVTIIRDSTDKISVTPALQVTYFEGAHVIDEQGERDEKPDNDTPTYAIYKADGTITNYGFITDNETDGAWYYNTSDDIFAGLPADRYIAHTWAIADTPVAISPGVYQAAEYGGEEATFTFYFSDDHQLERVEWSRPDSGILAIYVLLDEAPVTQVPAEVTADAKPFEV